MAYRLLNNAKMSVSAVASAGTGAFTLNAAVSGFQSFTGATPTNLGDADTSTFLAKETGGLWELFIGTYTAAGTSLARTTTIDSSNGGSNETFTTAAQILAVASAADLLGSVTEADGNFVVGTGSGWTAESGATARTSMGAQAQGDVLDDLNTLGASTADGEFLVATGAGTLAWEAPATALVSIGAATDTPLVSIWIPATAMISPTTNGAAYGLTETTATRVEIAAMSYDASTEEYAQAFIRMPKGWNEGTVTAVFAWTHPSTATNFGVVWGCEGVAVGNDDTLDVAFGTAQTVTDTGGTTEDYYASPATSAITIGGTPAAEDLVAFQFYRVAADVSDTLAVDAQLIGVTIYATLSTTDDT